MSSSLSTKGMLNLIVVYLVWGSTYLFIRLTVHEGSGFPPFAMAASRTLCASAILFVLAKGLGQWSRPSGSELRVLIVSGLLLWLGGNGLVAYAEHHANSGYAALVVGTTPMWSVIMESILEAQAAVSSVGSFFDYRIFRISRSGYSGPEPGPSG